MLLAHSWHVRMTCCQALVYKMRVCLSSWQSRLSCQRQAAACRAYARRQCRLCLSRPFPGAHGIKVVRGNAVDSCSNKVLRCQRLAAACRAGSRRQGVEGERTHVKLASASASWQESIPQGWQMLTSSWCEQTSRLVPARQRASNTSGAGRLSVQVH